MLGACLGSFLNVVVYRMPAGKSLSHPGSHCPRCGHAIRWYDNVPILGWIWLFGRCRDCRAPIAVRYPLVELLVTGIFAWQWHAHVYSQAGEQGPTTVGLVSFIWYTTWFTAMVAISLIEADGQRIPWRLLFFPVVIAMLLAFSRPAALPHRTTNWPGGAESIADGLLGALAIGAIEWTKRLVERIRKQPTGATHDLRARWAIGVLAAIFLGARVALPILLLASLTELIVAQRYSHLAKRDASPGARWRWSATVLLLAAIWPVLDQFR